MKSLIINQPVHNNPYLFKPTSVKPKYLKQWLTSYLEELKPEITINTYNNYNSYIYQHILPVLGTYLLGDLTAPVVKSFILDKLDHGRIRSNENTVGLSLKTVKEYFILLKKALDKAVEEGEILFNPCHSINFPKQVKEEVHALEHEEQDSLERHIKAEFKPNSSLVAKIALYAGLRNGEICALQIKDIDMERGLINVSKTLYRARTSKNKTEIIISSTKNKRQRYVPIQEDLLKDLKQYFKSMPKEMREVPNNPLFINKNGNTLEPKRLLYHFKKLLNDAGLSNIKFHDLRHTFATRCLECKIDMKIVSKMLGHSTIQITADLYTHVTNRTMCKAMIQLNRDNWKDTIQMI